MWACCSRCEIDLGNVLIVNVVNVGARCMPLGSELTDSMSSWTATPTELYVPACPAIVCIF